MQFENCLLDAVDIVLTWDIPDENLTEDRFADAVRSQACLMAGIDPDDVAYDISS